MENNLITVVAAVGKRQIILSGYITDEQNTANQLMAVITEQCLYGQPVELVLQNCYGGNVYEGIPVHNAVRDAGIDTRVEGLCASMGTIIAAGGKNRIMGRMSRQMIHAPQGKAEGGAAAMRSQADHLDQLSNDFAAIYAGLTGLTPEAVAKKWLDGTDHYLSAQECLKLGIATALVDGEVKNAVPDNVFKNSNPKAIVAYYEKQIENSNPKNFIMKKIQFFMAAFMLTKLPELSLSADATEDQLLEKTELLAKAYAEVSAKLKTIEDKVVADLKAAAKSLVDDAVKAKKITAELHGTYLAFAEKDFDGTKKALDAISVTAVKHVPLGAVISAANKQAVGSTEDRSTWDFRKWDKEDGKGLQTMKVEQPEQYNALLGALREKLKSDGKIK